MIVNTIADRRARQHLATRTEILDAASTLARTEGLAGISLRDLATRVGMRQPSLYTYFASKNAIYDALFARGWEALVERMRAIAPSPHAREALRVTVGMFVEFALEDPARFQLMCQRTVPGFEPSPEAFAPALEAYEGLRGMFVSVGIRHPTAVDIWTALITGLVNQQLANDPGGDRWTRLIDEVVDMFVAHVGPDGETRK